ncbi:MAG: DUF1553 domain-containing protein [Armatimonadetes bacterium]|nr:DUF1553 domain-containing protein [Armatimonadota bacterium]
MVTLLPALSIGLTSGVRAENAGKPTVTPEGAKFFETKVRPLLFKECYSCHNDKLQMGNLRLDSIAAMLKGNANGPAVVPGDPEKSTLVQVVRYDHKIKMPPTGKMKAADIAALTEWVKMGAPWPEAKAAQPAEKGAGWNAGGTAQPQKFWSLRPVKKTVPPKVKDAAWVKSPIDAFVLAKLEAKGLKPAPPADRRSLIRRAYFDLIGLPPTPNEVAQFVTDKSPDAFEKVVDRLLASPHYGERWGRHWLDVARYADSNGLDENKAFAHAFRYRDYVVAALNKDKPYNEFVTEQLAGDLMPSNSEAQRNERITATGFLVLGAKVLAEQDKPKLVMDIVDEQIEVTSKAFMGLTAACARCHDHKFDPIPTKDYYALAGFFKSTKTMKDLGFVSNWNERTLNDPAAEAKVREHAEKVKALEAALKAETDRANADLLATLRKDAGKYLPAGWELSKQPGLFPVAETPEKPGDPKRILIEAESYSRGNGNRDDSNYGKGIGIIHTTATPTFAEYDVDLPQTGSYQVEIRYASAQPRRMKLSVNGKEVKGDAAGRETGSFFPDGQKWEVQGVFAFAAGKNTLRLEGNGAIPHLDKLLIVSAEGKPGAPKPRSSGEIAKAHGLNEAALKTWAKFLMGAKESPVFGPWVALAQLPEAGFPAEAAKLADRFAKGEGKTAPAVARIFAGFQPQSLKDVAERYGALFAEVEAAWASEKGNGRLKNADLEAVRAALHDPMGPFAVPEKPARFYASAAKDTVKKAEEAVTAAKKAVPEMPVAMAVEEGKPENVKVHIRGSVLELGEEAPRRFLTVIAGENQKPIPMDRSGRLELAQWLTRPDHPLTSRVAVNRIWQGHFGEGIVRTPDNFGLLGDRPSHPELLDWLAATFVEGGWSMKRLHRTIMLSSAYQMGTAHDAKAELADPENRLLWRMPRRRLEAEPFRDAILAVSGKLDRTRGGSLLDTPNNDYVTNDQSRDAARYESARRSIYLPIIRNALYDFFQAFDVGDPSTVNARRATTTVAPQALFVMNSPFVVEQSKAFASGLLAQAKLEDEGRVREAYRRALGRSPEPPEVARALDYLKRYETALARVEPGSKPEERKLQAWSSVCQILFASNEFIYIN